ncbi:hypothetical protein V6N12_028701 [Hibiscus sabdariffa]|uniref:Uncharacterized protein n=1 Tax=Hibiscus sabdariffa TaxID=183260 RepID=A0ABR2F6L7_9ROSI
MKRSKQYQNKTTRNNNKGKQDRKQNTKNKDKVAETANARHKRKNGCKPTEKRPSTESHGSVTSRTDVTNCMSFRDHHRERDLTILKHQWGFYVVGGEQVGLLTGDGKRLTYAKQ